MVFFCSSSSKQNLVEQFLWFFFFCSRRWFVSETRSRAVLQRTPERQVAAALKKKNPKNRCLFFCCLMIFRNNPSGVVPRERTTKTALLFSSSHFRNEPLFLVLLKLFEPLLKHGVCVCLFRTAPVVFFCSKHRGVVRCRSVVRLVLLLEEKNPKNRCFLLFGANLSFCCSSCSETHRLLSLEESQEKKELQKKNRCFLLFFLF